MNMTIKDKDCLFCPCVAKVSEQSINNSSLLSSYSCSNCGNYSIDNKNKDLLVVHNILGDSIKTAIISFSIRRMQKDLNDYPLVDFEMIQQILKNNDLPGTAEQANNFILWLGGSLKGPGKTFSIGKSIGNFTAYIGAMDRDNIDFIYRYLIDEAMIEGQAGGKITLTFKGWQRYESLLKQKVESRKAFMALPFGDFYLNHLYPYFKKATEQTGFNLKHLGENKKAGLIDDKLRVEIRKSRFLIAELTDGNKGAYWEAGFSEGLGRPVIYSCERKYFKDKKTHFDTNHLHTVLWEKDKLKDAAKELKATIRATLPEEALLEDDEDK